MTSSQKLLVEAGLAPTNRTEADANKHMAGNLQSYDFALSGRFEYFMGDY